MALKKIWIAAVLTLFLATPAQAGSYPYPGCRPEPITVNTPTGIAGCQVWGRGIASHYGPGNGVAMNFCTWALRHSSGCGWVTITSVETGRSATVPVIDFCDCFTTTSRERVVDMQYSVVEILGLDLSRGLYPVKVIRARGPIDQNAGNSVNMLPNTALPRGNASER